MVYLEWAKADRNIQYRVINAIIKERIYPEQTYISQKGSLIEIQYHMHVMVKWSFSNVHERPKTLLYQGFCHF
ncbi:Siderophore biosynthesis protein [Staphylococcus aureus]|nr:Siderophore biosynthesis protein [Staphylococcus aureus]